MPIPRSDGYVLDVPYTRGFFAQLAPAWLDHAALLSGYAPPEREDGFVWCDIGCGQGVTAVVLAATHPQGLFYGIDLMPAHIENARSLAAAAHVTNAHFYCADFATDLELLGCDYIVAHGVYSWVDNEAKDALHRFIGRHLKPGGLAYLSYNAMPGWAADVPFQHLIFALGRTFSGDSVSRFRAAAEIVRAMAAAGVPALTASTVVKRFEELLNSWPIAYLPHEYMVGESAWRPLWFSEVCRAMAAIGLVPAGSATLVENHDSFTLGNPARETISRIAGEEARELVRDFFVSQRFRRDVFIREGSRIDEHEQRRRLLDSTFALARPPTSIQYSMTTPAGRLTYYNRAARAIVDGLASGPRSLSVIAANSGVDNGELLANAFALCAAGDVRPVEPTSVSVTRLNRILLSRVEHAEPIRALALPCGTALRLEQQLLLALRDGSMGESRFQGWPEFLASHNVYPVQLTG